MSISLLEIATSIAKLFKAKNKVTDNKKDLFADQVTAKEIVKAKSFSIPKFSFAFGKNQDLKKGEAFNQEIEQDNSSAKAIIEDELKKEMPTGPGLENHRSPQCFFGTHDVGLSAAFLLSQNLVVKLIAVTSRVMPVLLKIL
jgi:hypothetical protein